MMMKLKLWYIDYCCARHNNMSIKSWRTMIEDDIKND